MEFQPSVRSVDVEMQRIADYDRPQVEPAPEVLQQLRKAVGWATEHFSVGRKRPAMGKTKLEAIKAAIEYVKTSNCKDASPGYPLNQTFKTKLEALENAEVVKDLIEWWMKLGTSEVEAVLMSMSLKDEIMKTKKVEMKKTRLFMAMPLFHHVAMVAIFQNMQDAIFDSQATWCSAGRDFHYGGWDSMMEYLKYQRKFGADAEAYDMSIERYLWSAGLDFFQEMAPAGYELEIEDLFGMALDGFCVTSRGHVLQKHIGNPSGWFLTLLLNTVVMYMLLAITWMRVFPDSSRADFEKWVRAWLCGDDSLVAVHFDQEDFFTGEEFVKTWEMFGIKAKELHASEDFEHLEYCGATSVKVNGRWCRRPRVQKFLDSLVFTLSNDPLYKLQRAVSIYHELWPVEEKQIVRDYLDYLVRKYKYLGPYLRQYQLSEAELCKLHTGLEGASCKQERTKKTYEVVVQGRIPQNNSPTSIMTKTAAQKAAKKAEKQAAKAALKQAAGAAAVKGASALADVAAKKAKKKGGFWGALAGAAKMAAELAPTIAPLLLAKHAPSAARAAMIAGSPAGSTPASAVAGVPIASPVSCATCTGMYSMSPKRGADGRVQSVRIQGMDYVADVASTGVSAGDTLVTVDLNPMSDDWSGTQLQRFAGLFERYRPHRVAGLLEPSCAATDEGQVIAFIDPDPDDEWSYSGKVAIQVAASHEGADISQVWGVNCCAYAFDKDTQDFYADADGSDARLISPGKLRVLANTDIDTGLQIGTLYVTWDYEFKIPQLESVDAGGDWALLDVSVGNASKVAPLGATSTWTDERFKGTINAVLSNDGTKSIVTGLQPGDYYCQQILSTAMTGTVTPTVGVDAEGNYTVTDIPSLNQSVITAAGASDCACQFTIHVSEYTTDPAKGCFTLSYAATGGTSQIDGTFMIFRVKPELSLRKKKTLQDYERDVDALTMQVVEMRRMMAELAAVQPVPQQQLSSFSLFSKPTSK